MIIYHGTSQLNTILEENRLKAAPTGDRCVSLTLSPTVARHFADLPRDETNGVGILLLNADKLAEDYELIPYTCINATMDEYELQIWEDIYPLNKYLEDYEIIVP